MNNLSGKISKAALKKNGWKLAFSTGGKIRNVGRSRPCHYVWKNKNLPHLRLVIYEKYNSARLYDEVNHQLIDYSKYTYSWTDKQIECYIKVYIKNDNLYDFSYDSSYQSTLQDILVTTKLKRIMNKIIRK